MPKAKRKHSLLPPSNALVLPSLLVSTLVIILESPSSAAAAAAQNLLLPSDAAALVDFKSKADANNNIYFPPGPNASLRFCEWQGVTCFQNRVVRLVLQGLDLGGIFAPNTLTRLDQLRVLSLQNDSLSGPIPDLSALLNLKSLFLAHNSFTGYFPSSVLFLRRLRSLDVSYNDLAGPLPTYLTKLDRLYYLRLESNRFNGTIPALNQTALRNFNVSRNNLSGAIPVTATLSRFEFSAYSGNPALCGEIIRKVCHPGLPFFHQSNSAGVSPPPPRPVVLGQSAEVRGVELGQPYEKKRKRTAVIIGFSAGVFVLIASLLCLATAVKRQRTQKEECGAIMAGDATATAQAAAVVEQEDELEEKVKKAQGMQVAKSGNLVFCAGEAELYTLEQLMRASAELLGRGTLGTTYKAMLDNRLIVTVKRLDPIKLGGAAKEVFQQHMESVGGLRHPNLIPLRAFFQAKDERLVVYDYQPNGSLFSLVHGSKSARAKPLHWTSCLKIAEDVAQGLSYIHQAWRLVHGNLKSSNVLLGPDFEACLTDYCLAALATSSYDDDPDSAAYRAPETRNLSGQATPKCDVYAFGVLLMELLSGKLPSQHPFLVPHELMHWVCSAREDDAAGEDDRLRMLIELAITCSLTSPEQRPTMWQVLKMIQEIKETVLTQED